MERSLRLPVLVGALEGALLAVLGIVALSFLFLERVGIAVLGEQPEVVLQLSLVFFVVLSVVFSAVFGAVTAYLARAVVPLFQPELQIRGGRGSALVLGAILGALLGTVAAFVGVSVVGQQTDAGFVIPFLPAVLLVTLGGAVFGAGTAVGVYAFSEPALEGPEAEEIHQVRRRLLGAFAMPVAFFLAMAVLVVGLGTLFLRFHIAAPVLGLAVAGGILAFASLIASRPRGKVPVAEVLLAVAGIGVVVLVMVAILSVALPEEHGGEEDHGESATSNATSEPSEEGS